MIRQGKWADYLFSQSLFSGHAVTQDSMKIPKMQSVFLVCVGIAFSSRVLYLIFFIIGRNVPYIQGIPGEDHHLALYKLSNLHTAFDSAISYGDFDWYSKLAADGYKRTPFSISAQQNWAFFPLQALLILWIKSAAVRFLFGLTTFLIGIGFFVSYLLNYMDRNEVFLSCAFVCFAPYAGSLSQFRPDSVLFTSLCATMHFAHKRQLVPCLIFLMIAGLSKPNGFLGALLVAPHFFEKEVNLVGIIYRNWLRFVLICLAGMFGLVIMSLISYLYTGNPLAWSQIQAAWGNKLLVRPIIQFGRLFLDPQIIGRSGWDFELFNWFVLAAALFSIYALTARKAFFLSIFSALYLLTTFAGFGNWTLMKHLAASPAMPIGLGLVPATTSLTLALAVLVVFATLFGLIAVAMGAGVGAALI